MKPAPRPRSILHVDLDPFFVSVERSLEPSLRGQPVIVGGGPDGLGVVAAASLEAREKGVVPGQSLAAARRACPEGVFRPGDLDAYARVSEEVTALLLSASRRVERPSADEAYVDLTPEGPHSVPPVPAAETIKDELHRRLGLDASLGLAGSRLAARIASSRARPRGLLIVLPGYEGSFLARQPVGVLPNLPPHLERLLTSAGFATLGELAEAAAPKLESVVGETAAMRLRAAARGEGEPPISVATPPQWILEETTVRDRSGDLAVLTELLRGLVIRACRRLRPFDLAAGAVSVEVVRNASADRRTESVQPPVADEETISGVATALAEGLFEPAAAVRGIQLRLSRLGRRSQQPPLFPGLPGPAGRAQGLL